VVCAHTTQGWLHQHQLVITYAYLAPQQKVKVTVPLRLKICCTINIYVPTCHQISVNFDIPVTDIVLTKKETKQPNKQTNKS